MFKNKIKIAQLKLNQHRQEGTRSKLNIFEVAALMDTVKLAEQLNNQENNSIFHSIHLN
jgi:hypothetical protein